MKQKSFSGQSGEIFDPACKSLQVRSGGSGLAGADGGGESRPPLQQKGERLVSVTWECSVQRQPADHAV